MNKIDYAFLLIEKLATEILKEKPDPEVLAFIINTAKELRK